MYVVFELRIKGRNLTTEHLVDYTLQSNTTSLYQNMNKSKVIYLLKIIESFSSFRYIFDFVLYYRITDTFGICRKDLSRDERP